MCLTPEALFLFISVLSSDIVEVSDERVTIDAEVGLVTWDFFEDQWCTVAPLLAQSNPTR